MVVIPLALIWITQHIESFLYILEDLGGILVWVFVWMPF